jgi:hypothetical protein
VPIENIEIVHGDTATTPFGMGSYGSRSLAVGGSAIMKAADKIIAKGKKIAAHLMEASVADVVFEQGTFKVAGTDKAVPLGQAVFAAYVPHNYPLEELEPGMDENAFYDPSNFVYPAGTQICEVEIDPETGMVEIVNHTAVDDFGNIVNPMIVDGPGPWRHRPGRRPGADGERRLRQGDGPARERLVHGLHHAARRRRAVVQARQQGHALPAQSAGREGMRRGRCDRRPGRRDECRP